MCKEVRAMYKGETKAIHPEMSLDEMITALRKESNQAIAKLKKAEDAEQQKQHRYLENDEV